MRKYLKFAFLIVLAALIFWWFGRGLDLNQLRQEVARADWRLIAIAVVVMCTTYVIRTYRWRVLLAPLTPASWRELFAATTVGFSAIFLLGRAGELVRPAYLPLSDKRVKPGASFVTVMVERVYDMAAVILLFAANLLWFSPVSGGDPKVYMQIRQAGAVMLIGAILGLIFLVWFKRKSHIVIPSLRGFVSTRFDRQSIAGRVSHTVVDLLSQLAKALSVLVNTRELLVTVGWTALLWGVIIATYWLVLHAFGMSFGVSGAIFVLGGALVGSLVPTPGGGAGGFHAATAGGLIYLGATSPQAWAAASVLHLIGFAFALPFGLYFFLRGGIQLSKLRASLDTPQPSE